MRGPRAGRPQRRVRRAGAAAGVRPRRARLAEPAGHVHGRARAPLRAAAAPPRAGLARRRARDRGRPPCTARCPTRRRARACCARCCRGWSPSRRRSARRWRCCGPSAARAARRRVPGAKRPRDQRPDLSKLPKDPGVYVFRDADGHPLYVGKSVCLRTRARAHFTTPVAWTGQAEHVDYQPTESELGALLLENRLIKRLRPPGNVNLKKSADGYVYLRCRLDIPYPILEVAREPAPGHAVCVGPVRGRAAAAELVEQLNSLFGLRHCGRAMPRPPVAVRLRADGPLPVALPGRPGSEPLPRAAGRGAAAVRGRRERGAARARRRRRSARRRRRRRTSARRGCSGGASGWTRCSAASAARCGPPTPARGSCSRRTRATRRARTRSGSSAGASSTGARRRRTPTRSRGARAWRCAARPRPGLGGWLPAEELDEARIVGLWLAGHDEVARAGAGSRVITGLDHVQVAAPPGCEDGGAALLRRAARAARGGEARVAARGRRRLVPAAARSSCTSASPSRSRPRSRATRRSGGASDLRRARRAASRAAGAPVRWDDRLPGRPALLQRRPVGQPARATCRRPSRGRRAARAVTSRAPAAARASGSGRMSVATTCMTGAPVSLPSRCGRSERIHFELWPGSVETITSSWRRGSHTSATASIGLASPHMPSASMPGLAPCGERLVEPPADGLAAGEPRPLPRHQERHLDRAPSAAPLIAAIRSVDAAVTLATTRTCAAMCGSFNGF